MSQNKSDSAQKTDEIKRSLMQKEFELSSSLLPVLTLEEESEGCQLAEILLRNGLNSMEITFRTDYAAKGIAKVLREFPDFVVGAGTILTIDHFELALEAGASFLVSPGISADILEQARNNDTPYIPGAATPTEIQQLVSIGYKTIKIFPAEAIGGPQYLRQISTIFSSTVFLPSGGIDDTTARNYLRLRNVSAIAGSWFVVRNNKGYLDLGRTETTIRKSIENLDSATSKG
ncbi:MAG: keto-deoxy-phosphogluconate aldolase [Gammaproteobacteria bacterium]|nr:keto-deoxy-phosphogluconate aldolase [Gammaproteobacteria bacterium]